MLSYKWGIFSFTFFSFSSSSVPPSNPSFMAQILVSRGPRSQPWGPKPYPRGLDLGLLARIWTSKLRFGAGDWNLALHARIWDLRLGFGPQGWDLGLKAGILLMKLRFGPWDWNLGLKSRDIHLEGREVEEEGEESFLHVRKHRSSTSSGPLPKSNNCVKTFDGRQVTIMLRWK